MATPDPSLAPLAVWLTGSPDVMALVQQGLDVLLVGFGVVASLLAALLVATGLRRH